MTLLELMGRMGAGGAAHANPPDGVPDPVASPATLHTAIESFSRAFPSELCISGSGKNHCEDQSKAFAHLVPRAEIVRFTWRYLDDGQEAVQHVLVLADGVGIDWTANQFANAGELFPVPYIIQGEDVEAWATWIDREVHRSKYEEPEISVRPPRRHPAKIGSRALRGYNVRARLVTILEDYVDIHLAHDPDALDDLVARFGEAGATFLASGSQRIVFDLGDGTVGKVDYDVDATANGLEAKNWKTWRAVRPLLCPVLYTSPGARLLVMPFAESITEPASGKPPVKSRVKKMEAAMRTFGPDGVYLSDGDFELNWGWYNGGPVLLDYAQEPE